MTTQTLVLTTTASDLRDVLQQCVADALANWSPTTTPGPFDHLPELLDRKQAADLLGITLPTLDSWARQGKVEKYHLDGLVRLRKTELLASLKNLRKYRHSAANGPVA